MFHVLEPVVGKIAEKPKAPGTFGRSLFGGQRSDWFRPYRVCISVFDGAILLSIFFFRNSSCLLSLLI